MTIPALSHGDPVRRAVCGATYLDSPSDAARPLLYAEGGGKWSLAWDGVDDRMSMTFDDSGSSGGEVAMAFRGNTSPGGVWDWSGLGCWLPYSDGNVYDDFGGVRNFFDPVDSVLGVKVLYAMAVGPGGARTARVNGVVRQLIANGFAVAYPATVVLGGNVALNDPGDFRLAGLIFTSATLSAPERAARDSYLGSLL